MIAKKERHENELDIFQRRTEGGVIALRAWLYARRDEINATWFLAAGDELLQMQGEARQVARMIRLIDQGPKITSTERA